MIVDVPGGWVGGWLLVQLFTTPTRYRERGFLIVRNVFSQTELATVQNACDRLVDEEAAKLVTARKLTAEQVQQLASAPFETRLRDLYEAAGALDGVPLLFRHRLHKPGFETVFCNERVRCGAAQSFAIANCVPARVVFVDDVPRSAAFVI